MMSNTQCVLKGQQRDYGASEGYQLSLNLLMPTGGGVFCEPSEPGLCSVSISAGQGCGHRGRRANEALCRPGSTASLSGDRKSRPPGTEARVTGAQPAAAFSGQEPHRVWPSTPYLALRLPGGGLCVPSAPCPPLEAL